MRMPILSTWAQGFCLLYWRFCRPLLSTMSGNPQWLRAAYVICQADRIAASGVWSGPFPFWYIQHHSDPMYYPYNDHTMYDLELSVCVSLHKREQWNAIWNESNIPQCNAFCQSPGCSDDFTWYSRPMVCLMGCNSFWRGRTRRRRKGAVRLQLPFWHPMQWLTLLTKRVRMRPSVSALCRFLRRNSNRLTVTIFVDYGHPKEINKKNQVKDLWSLL